MWTYVLTIECAKHKKNFFSLLILIFPWYWNIYRQFNGFYLTASNRYIIVVHIVLFSWAVKIYSCSWKNGFKCFVIYKTCTTRHILYWKHTNNKKRSNSNPLFCSNAFFFNKLTIFKCNYNEMKVFFLLCILLAHTFYNFCKLNINI